MVTAPQFRSAQWGILIVDPARGDTLYSRNAGKLFMPASNMKVVTGAVALAKLGADFRFRTSFGVAGVVRDGVLDGDLVVTGRGDPTVSDTAQNGDAIAWLGAIADSLAAYGIREISGDVVAGADLFTDPIHGWGWPWDGLFDDDMVGVDALMFNLGSCRIRLAAGAAVGDTALATLRHAIGYPRLIVRMTTVAQPAGVQLSVDDDTIAGTITLSGTIALGRDTLLAISYPQPRDAYLAALRTALRTRGVAISARRLSPAAQTAARPLFFVSSRPLRELMPMMQKPSQNQIAEILLKTLGLERGGAGRADSGAAVVGRQLMAWGASGDGFVVRDGSGLSRYDYLSPETLVRTMAAMRRDTAFAIYYSALPIAGVDGTMRNRLKGTAAQGNVRAKTGFISNARSLSGYVTTVDGRMLIFTVLCNNWTARRSAIDAVQDAIALRLAAYSEHAR